MISVFRERTVIKFESLLHFTAQQKKVRYSPSYFFHKIGAFLEKKLLEYFPVLLHNGNKYVSIPNAHTTKIKNYMTALVLEKIKYHEHQ